MSSMTSTLLQRRWKKLLAWLEGHGFQPQNLPLECREMTCGVIDSRSPTIVETKHRDTPSNGLFARSACMVRAARSPTADELHE